MTYIQEVVVRGLGGKRECEISLDRHVNVIHGSNGVGKSTLLLILRSVMMGDSSMLRDAQFTTAEVRIFSEADQTSYRCALEKTDNAIEGAPRGERNALSAWRIEPGRPDLETPMWPHLHLPTSRRYVSHSKYAIFHRRDGAKGESREMP